MKEIKKEYLTFFAFAALVAVFYGNTLNNGYIYDDVLIIPQNPYIQSLKYLPKVITGCMWESTYFDQCKGRAHYYRPVQTLSYILTYQISSDPWVFHLVNLIYFLTIVCLIYILGKILTGNSVFAFVSAFIFLIHPLNSEVVNWVAAVPELTFAIFVLAATISYIKYRQTGLTQKFWLAAIFYFFALLAKEPAVFLPAIFLFIDWTLFNKKPEDYLEWKEAKNYFVFAGFAAVYMMMRFLVLGAFMPRGKSPFEPLLLWDRVHSFFILLVQYLQKFFWPEPLVFFNRFEKSVEFFNEKFLISFAVVVIFAAAAYFAFKKKKNLLFFSLVWFFFFILPVTIFIDAAGESVFSERYDFVPGIGFCFAISYFFAFFWQKSQKARIWMLLLLLAVAMASVSAVIKRNADWHDNETFYKKNLEQNPDATPIRFNYAVLLRNEKWDFDSAKEQLEEIVRRKPEWMDISMVYMHLGDYYMEKGDEATALDYYHKAATASADWKTHFALNRLGVYYAKKEDYLQSVLYFCQAVQVNPDSAEIKANLDRATSLVEFEFKDNPQSLYDRMVTEKVFAMADKEKIRYVSKTCKEKQCAYFFLPRLETSEVVLPFLLVGATEKGEAIKIEDQNFDPQKNQIILVISDKYQQETVSFIFATCDGKYYEVIAKPQ